MIFWDNFKIQNSNNVTVTVTATTVTVGSTTKPALDLGDAVLKADNLFFTHGITLPSGTTFDGPVTLSPGSSFAGAVILPSGSGISGILSSGQLNVSSATITGSLSANAIAVTTNISAASATISGSLVVNGTASLPTNTTIGGTVMLPGPRQSNILRIDGHFEANEDWVSVYNLSTSPIYIYVQLYQDAAYTVPYLANGQQVKAYTETTIQPGKEVRVLSFTDPADQFYAMNGYVRIKYSTTAIVDSASKGFDLNKQIRAKDISGYNKEVYAIYDPSTAPAPWLRTVLYESDKEHWYVVNCSTAELFANMRQTMQADPYYCNYVMILGGQAIDGGWEPLNSLTHHFYGGVIGFKSVDE